MDDSTIEYIKHTLKTTIDKASGEFVQQDEWTEKHRKIYKANTRGMQKMKKYDYCNMQEDSISSKLDLKMWNKLVTTYKKNGFCKHTNGLPLTINDIAAEFKVTRQKVSAFIRRCKESGFIQIEKRIIFVNPFVLTPYGISDSELHLLQQEWTRRIN